MDQYTFLQTSLQNHRFLKHKLQQKSENSLNMETFLKILKVNILKKFGIVPFAYANIIFMDER